MIIFTKFLARMDRYNHDLGDDTDDTDDSPLFGSFSSYSPQSRKISQTRPPNLNPEIETDSLKKQLFRSELERTVAQLSLDSPGSAVQYPFKLEEAGSYSKHCFFLGLSADIIITRSRTFIIDLLNVCRYLFANR